MTATTSLTWKDKAVSATQGTQFGAIVCAALDRKILSPCFVGKAIVTSDGYVMCDFIDRNAGYHLGAFVGSYEDLMNSVNGLAAHLKFTNLQKTSLQRVINLWIATDYRQRE